MPQNIYHNYNPQNSPFLKLILILLITLLPLNETTPLHHKLELQKSSLVSPTTSSSLSLNSNRMKLSKHKIRIKRDSSVIETDFEDDSSSDIVSYVDYTSGSSDSDIFDMRR
jgi:hypothetical protein